jgi:integrase
MPKIENKDVEAFDGDTDTVAPRFITREQFEKLHDELPPHAQAMARFSVETGQRYSAVANLKWSAVDLVRKHAFVRPSTSKSRKAIALPLNEAALKVLKAQQGKHPVYVFAYSKKRNGEGRMHAPIKSVKTSWLKAVKRAGLEGFRWHDLRHTWSSWHSQNGTPPIILKELGGWSSLAMVERYSHLNGGHLQQWVETTR